MALHAEILLGIRGRNGEAKLSGIRGTVRVMAHGARRRLIVRRSTFFLVIRLDAKTLDGCFDDAHHFARIDEIFARVFG